MEFEQRALARVDAFSLVLSLETLRVFLFAVFDGKRFREQDR
jgi:hypothetical protein